MTKNETLEQLAQYAGGQVASDGLGADSITIHGRIEIQVGMYCVYLKLNEIPLPLAEQVCLLFREYSENEE